MLKAIIIEDAPDSIEALKKHIDRHPDIVLSGYALQPDEGKALIEKHNPDIVFLDIQLPGKSGFELLKEIDRDKWNFHLVFTTGVTEDAIRAIREGAHDYLIKSVTRTEFDESIRKIIGKSYVRVKGNIIKCSSIIYLKSDRNNMSYHLQDRELSVSKQTIDDALKSLPNSLFTQIHRSYIINIHQIRELNKNSALMKNGELITISEKYQSNLTRLLS